MGEVIIFENGCYISALAHMSVLVANIFSSKFDCRPRPLYRPCMCMLYLVALIYIMQSLKKLYEPYVGRKGNEIRMLILSIYVPSSMSEHNLKIWSRLRDLVRCYIKFKFWAQELYI